MYTITSDNGANMLKAINLIEKELSSTLTTESPNESDTQSGQDDAILNDTTEVCSNFSNSDDECSDK